jgi:arylsulfatase A-like enzyme
LPSRDPARPNILFVLTDDQGPWAMGCAGSPEIRTPNLDRLATEGLRFRNFFCTSPVCSPARASILTGRIPSSHGVHDWLSGGNSLVDRPPLGLIEFLRGQTGFTDLLARGGYACGLSGKWHLGDAHHPQKGFGFWRVHAKGGGPYYAAPMIRDGEVYKESRYVTDVITDNALAFLDEQADASAPFYLGVHYTAPHSPWGRAEHPPEFFEPYYNRNEFPSFPQGLPVPAFARFLSIVPENAEQRREFLSGYCAAITAMDAQVGRLLDRLERLGLRESTLVVFTSDNGMNMGHHGVYGKGNATFPQNMFEESVKVPTLLSLPGCAPAGQVVEDLCSHLDLRPTLLELAGIRDEEAGALPGRSFAALLDGRPLAQPRGEVIVHDEYGPVRMVRTDRWKYIHRYPYGPHELYDLTEDPGETRNLAGSPEHADRTADLRGRLESWFLRWGDPERDGCREAVTGGGQFGLCGPAGAGRERFAPVPGNWKTI